ncbi:hypothetical protein [Streptomyces sp. NPDC088736]|uniref:hypothetical protein n=1 Tax=Streptomyces sp. NPDC088736 TaxID=3365881 RepID=UPI00382A974A
MAGEHAVQGNWLDDEALCAAVREWVDAEELDAYRVEWMLDEAAAGRLIPTGDDAIMFALVEFLKSQGGQPSPDGRQRARDAMMAEVNKRSEGDDERDPARIE